MGIYSKDETKVKRSTTGDSVLKRLKRCEHRFLRGRRPRFNRAFERLRATAKSKRITGAEVSTKSNQRADARGRRRRRTKKRGRGTENLRGEQRGELQRGRSGATLGICSRKELERGERARHCYPQRIPCEGTAWAFAAAKSERGIRERCSRRGIRVEEALGLEFRGFRVGRGIVQDRPER